MTDVIRFRRLVLCAIVLVSSTARSDDRLEQSIVEHNDWIEYCTDLSVSVAIARQDLILYYIEVERDSGEVVYCLLSTGRGVVEKSLSLDNSAAMFLPPFPNGYDLRTGSPTTVPEALIRTEERVLVVSAPYGDFGIERIEPVSGNSYLVQVGYVSHSRVFHVTSDRAEAFFLTSGRVAEVTCSEDESFRIHVESHKGYFEGGGAFWFDATIDCEGTILDIVTQTSDCMSVEVLSERSGLDLSRIKRPEVCIER